MRQIAYDFEPEMLDSFYFTWADDRANLLSANSRIYSDLSLEVARIWKQPFQLLRELPRWLP